MTLVKNHTHIHMYVYIKMYSEYTNANYFYKAKPN